MLQTNTLFLQLAILLGLSVSVGYLTKLLKLPLLIAYLVVGVLISTIGIFDPARSELLTILPEIGVAFVLFLVGMELDLREIKTLGKPIIIASLFQIIVGSIAGYSIASLLGRPQVESIYLGLGLSFSSTIVIIKLLADKKDLTSLYGKLCLGITLVEDLVAIAVLMFMSINSSIFQTGLQSSAPFLVLIIKGAILLLVVFVLSKYVLNFLFDRVASLPELLFLSSLAWCFLFVILAESLGFSVVIGAFLAGIALANSTFHFEIQTKIKPLRDFFVCLFFIYLGSKVAILQITEVLPLILVFTFYALVIKPIIFLLILGAAGFKKHTIFQTALNLSQVSEFSLVILVVGLSLGVVSQAALTAMALVGVLSIIVSSIMISSSEKIYHYLSPIISFFEHSKFTHQTEERVKDLHLEDHVILVGAHRIGGSVLKFLQKEDIPFLVVDFNPNVVSSLVNKKIQAIYGDISDPEILEYVAIEKSKLIVSTATDLTDNLALVGEVKQRKSRAYVVTRASSVSDAEELYQAGSDFVIMPETISGDFISEILKVYWPSLKFFEDRPRIELGKLQRHRPT